MACVLLCLFSCLLPCFQNSPLISDFFRRLVPVKLSFVLLDANLRPYNLIYISMTEFQKFKRIMKFGLFLLQKANSSVHSRCRKAAAIYFKRKGEEINVQTYYRTLDVEIIFNAKQSEGGIGYASRCTCPDRTIYLNSSAHNYAVILYFWEVDV